MMVIKKKRLIPIILLLLIAAAGYFNLQYLDELPEEVAQVASGEAKLVSTEDETVSVSTETTEVMAENYFATARADREASRAEATETLKALLDNEGATPEAKEQATAELSAMAKRIEQEAAIESQILAKGYTDAVVYISVEGITVIVESTGITAADAAIIQELAVTETGRNPEEVKIIEVH